MSAAVISLAQTRMVSLAGVLGSRAETPSMGVHNGLAAQLALAAYHQTHSTCLGAPHSLVQVCTYDTNHSGAGAKRRDHTADRKIGGFKWTLAVVSVWQYH